MAWFWNRDIKTVDGTVVWDTTPSTMTSPTDYYIDCSKEDGQRDAYNKCDIVSSLVSRRAESIANLRVRAVDNMTGLPVDNKKTKEILAKLNRPNPKQDFKRFFRELDKYVSIHGKGYVRIVKSNIFNDVDYYIIPNEFIEEVYDVKRDLQYNTKVKYYQVEDGFNRTQKLSNDEVYVFYDGVLSTSMDEKEGGSRLASLSNVITSYVVLWEVRAELLANHGAKNLISLGVDNPSILASTSLNKEIQGVQNSYKKYGLRRGFWQSLILKSRAQVHRLTQPMSDFEFESAIKDAKKSCANAFSCPPELLGIESSRFKTIPEARKEFYTQACIPMAEYYIQNWLQMIGEISLDFRLIPDYTHMDFYQEAKLQEGIAFQQMASAIGGLVDKEIEGKPIMSNQEARNKLGL